MLKGAEMLADAGCRYVIVGHSERRRDQGESDEVVGGKLARVVAAAWVVVETAEVAEAEAGKVGCAAPVEGRAAQQTGQEWPLH